MMVQSVSTIQDKPFACDVKGCDMTFINKDHLEWHHKKHEMMLNLGLINKNNEVADQTPTPTRFFRNCEEVGLFQDLQNVNPFDELFKKAVDLAKNGVTLDVEPNNSDDTLHTPHILPHITEYQQKSQNNVKMDSDSEPFDFTTNDNDNNTDSIEINDNGKSTIKQKIKANLLKNENPVISVVPFSYLTHTQTNTEKNFNDSKSTNNSINNSNKNNCANSNYSNSRYKVEKIREMNRAAQLRCRRKKQKLWQEMEQDISDLKEENRKLRLEVQLLRTELIKYQAGTPMQGGILTPVVLPESDSSNVTTPVLLQVIPTVQIPLLSVLPENREQILVGKASNTQDRCTKKNSIKKPNRKIAPNVSTVSKDSVKSATEIGE